MSSNRVLKIYNTLKTAAASFFKNSDDSERYIIEYLPQYIDEYNLDKNQLIELFGFFSSYFGVQSYLMMCDFKNPELKNTLKTHRESINIYINRFLNDPQNQIKMLNKFGLLSKLEFFSHYSRQVFSHIEVVDQEVIINYLLNYPEQEEPDFIAQSIFFLAKENCFSDTSINMSKFTNLSKSTLLNASKKLLGPKKENLLSNAISSLRFVSFTSNGGEKDNYRGWTKGLISHLPVPKKPHHELVRELEEVFSKIPQVDVALENLSFSDEWKFFRIQGRTILLKNPEGNILAVKIKKENENIFELYKEFHTLAYLRKHAKKLNLKSYFPDPIGINKIDNLADFLKKAGAPENLDTGNLISLIGKKTDPEAYVYAVDASHVDYFTYLQDIQLSDETFCEANRHIVSDLFQLLANGMVYYQLADLFHDAEDSHEKRDDRGRYLVLVDLLRGVVRYGAGEVFRWKKAIEYSNLRGSEGIADFGDWISLFEYLYGEFSEKHFSGAKEMHQEKAGQYILANVMAEYLYVLFLIAGKRGHDLTQQAKAAGKPVEEINKIWLTLAEQQLDNCSQALSLFGLLSEKHSKEYLLKITNIEHLANQMRWWMTEDYIDEFKNNSIPPGIYDESVKLKLDFKKVRYFNDKVGFSINGIDQDLGAESGQEPIKEFNKMLYWMVSGVVCSYHVFNAANQEMDNMAMQLDLIDKIKAELGHLPINDEQIRLSIIKLRELQKKCDQLSFTFSLPKEQLNTLIAYRENFYRNNKASPSANQEILKNVREQHAARVIQQACRKEVKKIREKQSIVPLPPLLTFNDWRNQKRAETLGPPPSLPPFHPRRRREK